MVLSVLLGEDSRCRVDRSLVDRKVDHQMAELFELEEEVIRMSSDVKDKYERDMANTATGAANLPVRISILVSMLPVPLCSPVACDRPTDCAVRGLQQLA